MTRRILVFGLICVQVSMSAPVVEGRIREPREAVINWTDSSPRYPLDSFPRDSFGVRYGTSWHVVREGLAVVCSS